MSDQFGQGPVDEEFLPDREELEMQLMTEMESTVTLSTKNDKQLREKVEIAGTIFKYDLPVENVPIVFKNELALTITDAKESLTAT